MHLGNIEGAVVREDLYLTSCTHSKLRELLKRNWLKANVTHQEQRLEIVHDIFIMEKLTYLTFQKNWGKWAIVCVWCSVLFLMCCSVNILVRTQ